MKNIKKILCVMLAVMMLLGTSAAGASADSVKRVSCTMNGNGATSRGFCWYTLEKGASDLQLVKTADFDGTFSNAKCYSGTVDLFRRQYSHKVVASDLEPGTAYTYRVGDAAKELWSDPASFVTDDGDGSFKFAVIADVQASSDENFAHAFLTAKAAVETLPDAEFMANLGDYVNDDTNDEWDWYFGNFAPVNNTLTQVPVAGNHDGNITNKLNTFVFKNMFCLDESDNSSLEGVYYSFDYGNAHIAVLNTNDMYPMSQAQRNWLVNDMTNSDAMWKIVMMHRAAYSAGKNINKPDTMIMREVLIPLFDKCDIDMVFSGHDHMYMRTYQAKGDKAITDTTFVTETFNGEETRFAVDPEGTVYCLPSTAGTKRYNVNENAIEPIPEIAEVALSTKSDAENGGGCFCTVEIKDGKLVYRAYTVNDETQEVKLIDTYAISKSAAGESKAAHRDQSIVSSVVMYAFNFAVDFAKMMFNYIKLLFQVITK